MAVHKECVSFNHPVYKDQTNPSNTGLLIEAGDTVSVFIANDDGTNVKVDLIVVSVIDGGKGFCYDRNVANQDYRSSDIYRVHGKHQYSCAYATPELNYRALDVAITITGVSIDSVVSSMDDTIATLNATTAQTLEDFINSLLDNNGYATVYYDGSHFDVYIMGTTTVPDYVDSSSNVVFAAF